MGKATRLAIETLVAVLCSMWSSRSGPWLVLHETAKTLAQNCSVPKPTREPQELIKSTCFYWIDALTLNRKERIVSASKLKIEAPLILEYDQVTSLMSGESVSIWALDYNSSFPTWLLATELLAGPIELTLDVP